jgi:predicted nucleotidyltransferase
LFQVKYQYRLLCANLYICEVSNSTIYNAIRQTVESNLPGARVLLFGSRARGDQDRFSDYDLLIITPQTFTEKEKLRWSTKLDRAIVSAVKVPVDLLLNSEEEILQKQELPGHIIRSVMKEGIIL